MSQINSRSSYAKLQLLSGKYIFAPKLIPTLATFLLLPFFLSLGFWQLHRAEEKRLLHADFARRTTLPSLTFPLPMSSIENWRYRVIKLEGHFDNRHTFLLDNKFDQHRVGYHVITPFIVNKSPPILIDRGWIAMGESRAFLPVIDPIRGKVTIEGFLDTPPNKHFSLGKFAESGGSWPKRIQYIDTTQFSTLLGERVAPYIVLLHPRSAHGFVRSWQPVMTIDAARHVGYAIQWFLFAAILLVLFVILNIKNVNHE